MRGFRTLFFNAVNLAMLGANAVVDAGGEQFIPEAWLPYWLAGIAVGNALLRLDTKTAVGKAS